MALARRLLVVVVVAACGDPSDDAELEVSSTTEAVTGEDGTLTVNAANTVLNRYSALTVNAAAGQTTLTINNVSELDATSAGYGPLAIGDELMVIQMRGATIDSANLSTYGSVTALGNAGLYEFVNVAAINGNIITITSADCGGLKNSYAIAGKAQVVRVPQPQALVVNAGASITATPWNGTVGGVVAIHVGGTATLNGNGIDVSGVGFRGGAIDSGTSNGNVAAFRSTVSGDGGEKGEGIAGDGTTYDTLSGRFGKGAPANGGGGGNGTNAGGGGGANGNNGNAYTGAGVMDNTVTGAAAWSLDPEGSPLANSSGGGRGGYTQSTSAENALVTGTNSVQWGGDRRRNNGGRGGHPLVNDPATRLFMGGGGGAGDGSGGGAGAGGNGGGIVVLVAQTVTGSATIKANGGSGNATTTGKGPGGGGGGGSIVVRAGSLSGIGAQANGGFGGNQVFANVEAEGPGGGGGGGFIAVAGGSLGSATATGAAGGTTTSTSLTEFPVNGATKGADGQTNGAVTTLPGCFSDLTVLVTDSPDPVASGSNLSWTLTANNSGPNDAFNVTVTQTLPAGVTFQSASGSGWNCTFSAPTVTCTRGIAPIGASPDITVDVNVTLPSGTLSTSATISGSTAEFSTVNNSDSENTTVDAINDPPANTVPGPQTTAEDQQKSISGVSISDPDAGGAQVEVTLTVTNGDLSIGTTGLTFSVGDGTRDAQMTFRGTIAAINTALGSLVFRPTGNFSGNAVFTILTDDLGNSGAGGAKQDTDTVVITITPSNDPPTANDDTRTVNEDSSGNVINVLANDSFAPDVGETLSITSVTQPANGSAVIAGNNINFTPAANFSGVTTFNYTISDGNGGSDTATVTVTVTATNDNPDAVNDNRTVAEDSGSTVINVLANDSTAPDVGETLTVTAVSQPSQGSAAIGAGGANVTFTPNPNFNGTTAFTYTISDGNGGFDTATVTVTVSPSNDPPNAADDSRTVAEDSSATTITVLQNDSVAPDIGEVLTVTSVTQPANGTAAVGSGATSVTFTPAANFNGSTSFNYTVSDGNGGTDSATVVITVTSVNDVPTAANDTAVVDEDSIAFAIDVLANDSSAPDVGENLRVVAVTQPANGNAAVGVNGANVTFTPAANFNGATSFNYTVTDGNGGNVSASVAITVGALNDPPVAKGDVFNVALNSAALPLDVLANDTFAPDVNETLTITAVTQPENGVVAIIDNGTKVSFDPAQAFTGLTTFTYTISDGAGLSATATVTVGVGPDSDNDNIPDPLEEDIGTNPLDADTDDDGVKDGSEVDFDQDTDDDGLINALDPDSDNDGLYDGTEQGITVAGSGTDPGKGHFIADAQNSTTTDPLKADTDDGGVEDGAEDINRNGKVDGGETDPNVGADDAIVDGDGDGVPDAQETLLGTNPADKDSDDDGVEDGDEPNYADDTDADGKINSRDADSDNDGLNDGTELGVTAAGSDTNVGAGQFIADTDASTTTSALSRDTDRGGASDGEEDANHNGKVDSGERDPNDPADDIIPPPDADEDGLADDNDNCPNDKNGDQADEDLDGKGDACDADADGDGLNDGLTAGGGGCSTSDGGGGLALVLVLGVVLALRRPKAWAALALLVAIPRLSAAQSTGEPRNFSVERFSLASDRLGLLGVEWGEGRGHLAIDAALWIGFSNDPLVIYMDSDNRVGPLVEKRTSGALTVSLSPTDSVTLGVELPVVFSQDRPQNSNISEMLLTLKGGVGNIRLIPKLVLLDQKRYGVGVAIVPAVSLPSASSDKDYLSDDGASFQPELDISRSLPGWRLAANVGYNARHRADLLDLVVDDEIFTRLGVGYRFGDSGGPPIGLDAALSMAVAARDPFGSSQQTYVELFGGANVEIKRMAILFAAAGIGADRGFGTPDYRFLFGVRFGSKDRVAEEKIEQPKPDEGDDDSDGILNWRDECKADPEDKDGFRDDDGCPDLDNDKDSVPDKADKCPDQAGIPEINGCPAQDGDVDGVSDHLDKCPTEAEDFDSYQDEDGCPEPDNDSDGLIDAQDACPVSAGPADNTGCPDADGDADGVVDRLDNCPTVKGEAQFAGCAAKQLVVLTPAKIAVSQDVVFYRATIQPQSYKLLDNIAAVLKAQDKLTIEIGTYIDAGRDEKEKQANLDLTQKQAEAVVAYLVKKGVDASRMKAVGYGESEQIGDNKTRAGRIQNRRTVFKITGGNKAVLRPATPTPAPAPTP